MKNISWLVMCAWILTSCAGTSGKILHVNTEPKGAMVSMGEQTCHTPCVITVPEDEAYILQIQKEGFENQTVRQFSEWEQSPWLLGAATVALAGLLANSPSPKEDTMTLVISAFLTSLVDTTDVDIDVTMKAKESKIK